MLNLKFINLLIICICIFYVNAETKIFEKEKIQSLKIQTCKEDKDCTDYNSNYCSNTGFCIYDFYCHEKNCIISDENLKFIPIAGKSTPIEKEANEIILEACSSEANKNGECFTRICNSNSDCFSNKCIDNVCIVDDNLPLIRCSNEIHTDKIICKKAPFEKCKKNKECFYEGCDKNKTCHYLYKSDSSMFFLGYLMIYYIIFIIILIGIIGIIVGIMLFFIKCCKNKK